MKHQGLEWSGAASKAALEKIRTGTIATAPAGADIPHRLESPRREILDGMRQRARDTALVLLALFSLVVAFALVVALLIERLP